MKLNDESVTVPRIYLRRHEAARYLACSVRQVDQMKHDGALPFHRLGRRFIVFGVQVDGEEACK